jgi:hypothetical protein
MPSKEYGDFETALVFESQRNSKLPYRAPTTIIVRSQMYSSDATRNWKKLCSIPSDAKALDGGQLIAAARRRGSERKISKVDDVGTEKIKTIGDSLDGVDLVSERQPTRLRVDEQASGPPAVWLHPDGSSWLALS